jgi:hypothetical protein
MMNKKARKAFLSDFEHWYQLMVNQTTGIDGAERPSYVFKILSRFLFLYFLQHQGLLDNNQRYLYDKMEQCQSAGIPYHRFLTLLLQAIDTPYHQRSDEMPLDNVPYLRLFPESVLPDDITIPNQPFQEILNSLLWYMWDLEEQGEENRDEITPAILGYIVEKFVALKSPHARKSTGSFYTPEDICIFMSKSTVSPMILYQFESLTRRQPSKIPTGQEEAFLNQLIGTLDARECGLLLFVILPSLSILDPAVGAANFLVSALNLVSRVYREILAQIEHASRLQHPVLQQMLSRADETPGGRDYFIKKRILSRNLFGVDIQQEPLDISRMRLYLAMLSHVPTGTSLEPFPPLTFRLPCGNSLVGVDRITERERLQLARYPRYSALVETRKRLIKHYCCETLDLAQSASLYAQIQACRDEAYGYLNAILTERVATSSKAKKNHTKNTFTQEDLESLQPFHWAFDFDEVMNHPWWVRCDPEEAQIIEIGGQICGMTFGPHDR